MRLVCPNCGAQYEVDEKVIPETGRDVQCSNCGHTWFQRALGSDPELADEMGLELPGEAPDLAESSEAYADEGLDAPGLPQDAPEFEDDDGAHPEEVAFDASEDEEETVATEDFFDADAPDETPAPPSAFTTDEDDYQEDSDWDTEPAQEPLEDDVAEAPATPPAPAQQELDQSVLSILREEAEFEQKARTEETGLETQTDFGDLDEPASEKKGLRERMARLRGLEGPAVGAAAAPAIARKGRDLLPDIEEINSTLRATEDRDGTGSVHGDEELDARRKRFGFRRTFLPVVAIVVLLVAVYTLSPAISKAVPATAPFLESYVTSVNGFRGGLDTAMSSGVDKLTQLLGQISGDT